MAVTRNRNKANRESICDGNINSCNENSPEIYKKNDSDYYAAHLYTFGLMTYNTMANLYSYAIGISKFISQVAGVYLAWITLHYGAAHLYTKFCAHDTLVGFILSPFMVVAPHCRALRWVVHTASGVIENMWLVFGTWVCANILTIPGTGPGTGTVAPVA
jgi:hypothetical protein